MLPVSGKNFDNYSLLAVADGRTFVHSQIHDVVVNTYKTLELTQPSKVYKYGETGFATGGRFRPHQHHQNGLSVDFMTPVVNTKGQSVQLPTHIFNRFGYNIEFNQQGQYDDLTIDYEAMAAHLASLHQQAQALGVKIWRVVFDPKLLPGVFTTSHADYLKQHLLFATEPTWVRHDEHYHVDFDLPCKAGAIAKH